MCFGDLSKSHCKLIVNFQVFAVCIIAAVVFDEALCGSYFLKISFSVFNLVSFRFP